MATPTYGTTAPGAIEPFSIESTLANIVGTNNPAAAGGALDLYQLQNQVSRSNYGYDLAQQHEFAKQQLAQQMREQYLKAIPEFAKSNTLGILASGADAQQAFNNADPSVIADAIAQARAAQHAKDFAEAGKGTEGFSNAGLTFQDSSQIPGLGGANVNIGENARIAAERIRANAMLGEASMRANAKNASSRAPGVSFAGASNPALGGQTPNLTFNPNWTPEQNVQWFTEHGFIKPPIQPPASNAQPGTPAAQPSIATPNKVGGLPAAKQDTPTAKPAVAPVQALDKIKNDVRGAIERTTITPQNKDMYADIKAGYVGGQPNIVQKPNGKFVVIGKSKREYTENE